MSDEIDSSRHAVAATDEIPDRSAIVVEVGDRQIAVFNYDGEFYALDNVCTHQGGPLGDGKVADGCVYCPWHGHQFDLETGEHGQLDRLDTEAFETVVEGDQVFVLV